MRWQYATLNEVETRLRNGRTEEYCGEGGRYRPFAEVITATITDKSGFTSGLGRKGDSNDGNWASKRLDEGGRTNQG